MKTSLATRALIGMSFLFLAVLMSTYLGFLARENQIASRKLVEHTYQVLEQVQVASSILKDAETGQRGFLLTNDRQYLEEYIQAKAQFYQRIERLKVLTIDNPEQNVRIHELSLHSREIFAKIQQSIKLRQTAGAESALALAKSQESSKLTNELRRILEEMIDSENNLLKQRAAQLQESTKKATEYSIFFSCLSLIALLISANLLYHFIRATKKAEDQRRQSELDALQQRAFLKLVVDTMSDGLVVANAQGKFVMHNPAAEELIGELLDVDRTEWSQTFGIYTSDREQGFLPSEQLPLVLALKGESTNDVEMYVHNERLDEGRWISVSGRPVSSAAGDFAGGLVVMQDITHRKEAEKRVTEFYSTVSHELRTPLTSIRGSLGLIEGGLAGPITSKTAKLVGIAKHECERLVRLVNDILDLRKIEAGMLELKKSNVETQALIKRTVDGIRGMAQEANVDVVTELNTGGPLFCDEDRIIQVLTNLVSNAIKFSPSGGRVLVSLSPGLGNNFRFTVRDQGPGIPAAQMHKLFGKFQQLDQSDGRPKEGTGLGLAISKRIVDEHEGCIGVDSEPGKGSEFWFELPATFSPVPLVKDEHLKKHPAYPALIVEDDDSFAESLRCELIQHGFEVVRAGTLAEADAFLEKTKPVVIMLDLTLPDGDGIDFLRKLNANAELCEIPIVVVTAGNMDEGKASYAFPALLDWVSKPFDDDRLQQVLKVVRKQMKPACVLLLETDPSMREVLQNHLESMGVNYIDSSAEANVLDSYRLHKPDLVIMDMTHAEAGLQIVEQLNRESKGLLPIIIYSSLDLTVEQEARIKSGLVSYLMKSVTSEDKLVATIRNFLSSLLLKLPQDEKSAAGEVEKPVN